jgi:hypothetical protein
MTARFRAVAECIDCGCPAPFPDPDAYADQLEWSRQDCTMCDGKFIRVRFSEIGWRGE